MLTLFHKNKSVSVLDILFVLKYTSDKQDNVIQGEYYEAF